MQKSDSTAKATDVVQSNKKQISFLDCFTAYIGSHRRMYQFLYPSICSRLLQTLEDLQASLETPYSDGFLLLEIAIAFAENDNSIFKTIYIGQVED